jgi:hypothetical protein
VVFREDDDPQSLLPSHYRRSSGRRATDEWQARDDAFNGSRLLEIETPPSLRVRLTRWRMVEWSPVRDLMIYLSTKGLTGNELGRARKSMIAARHTEEQDSHSQ